MKGRILLLSFAAPPFVSGSAIIVANLARQFKRNEMIVAGEKPYGCPPLPWSEEWPRLVYVQSVWPFVRGTRFWRPLQFPYLLARCIQLVLCNKIESVIVVYPQAPFLFAGYLTAILTGRRLFPYFHNTYYENKTGWRKRFAAWLQERVFRKAEHVFVMSEGMSELFRERYPGLKQSPLRHSFNGPIPQPVLPPPVGSPLRVVMCGNLTTACADAASRMGDAVAACSDTHLTLLTSDSRNDLVKRNLLRDGVACETVSMNDVPARLAEAHLVLLPHGLVGPLAPEEYRTIFPTRTIEYLLCGRPILAHSTPGSFLTRFLVENDCALVVDRPDVNALRQAIGRLRQDAQLRSKLVQNALKTAEQFQAQRVATELRRVIEADNLQATNDCPSTPVSG